MDQTLDLILERLALHLPTQIHYPLCSTFVVPRDDTVMRQLAARFGIAVFVVAS